MINTYDFPNRIVLELTPLCNLSCFMCPRHHIEEGSGYMQKELLEKLVNEIRNENSDAIVLPFWRGESCLHPDFTSLMGYMLDQDIRIHLSTNGHFMDSDFMDVFYRCEFITFSIHTDLGYKNAIKFVADKPKWSKVTTQISFVNTEKSTEKYIQECTKDKDLKGFDSVRLYIEHTIGGEFGKSICFSQTDRKFCSKLDDTFVVAYNGGFSRCNHVWNDDKRQNLASHTIKEVWNGSNMQEIRESYPDAVCAPCNQWGGHTNGESWRMLDGLVVHTVYGGKV